MARSLVVFQLPRFPGPAGKSAIPTGGRRPTAIPSHVEWLRAGPAANDDLDHRELPVGGWHLRDP